MYKKKTESSSRLGIYNNPKYLKCVCMKFGCIICMRREVQRKTRKIVKEKKLRTIEKIPRYAWMEELDRKISESDLS
jgi:hypothetical protein